MIIDSSSDEDDDSKVSSNKNRATAVDTCKYKISYK